jgi:small subunit ribosomal protein S16
VNAIDGRTPRDGRVIEELGFYDPVTKDPAKQFSVNRERVAYWISKGAQPSDTVKRLLAKADAQVKQGQ